jgi:hypothetical protein
MSASAPPPPMRAVITAGIAGALLLARGRTEGLALVETSADGAWRSFAAALICLPALLAIRFFSWASMGVPEDGIVRALIAEITAYTISWAGFALLTLPLAKSWGRDSDWPRFIAAWNWTNIVQYALMLALTVPGVIGLPNAIVQVLMLVGIAYACWLEWFVARNALGVDGQKAAALVGLDLFLGLFLAGLLRTLSGE